MEFSVERADIGSLQTTRPNTVAGSGTDDGFGSILKAASTDTASPLDQAERLAGTRISAPPGGCGCDALAAQVAPDAPAEIPPTDRSVDLRFTVRAGDMLFLAGAEGSDERQHLAVARNATDMIGVTDQGVVEVQPIRWDRVLGLWPPR